MSVSEALEAAVKTWVQRRNVRRIDSIVNPAEAELTLEERLVASVAVAQHRKEVSMEDWKKKAKGTDK
jgi:hypothetical protein